MVSFSDWRPALLFPQTKQYDIITADFNRTNRFSCFLGLLGREHMVWKRGQQSQLLDHQGIAIFSNGLAVIPFKLTSIRITRVASYFQSVNTGASAMLPSQVLFLGSDVQLTIS